MLADWFDRYAGDPPLLRLRLSCTPASSRRGRGFRSAMMAFLEVDCSRNLHPFLPSSLCSECSREPICLDKRFVHSQGLRKLGQFLVPLSRVRDFVGVDDGPTPRDAVLLKSLLVIHEGIAWATDRPHYRCA